jgi:response regulator RpfG family c-di-GMP phosphodiesterase
MSMDDLKTGSFEGISGDWPEPQDTSIYVVDDDNLIVQSLTRFLKAKGYQVTGFLNPVEAKEAIEAQSPNLLMTDKDMPQMTGIELAQAALEANPELPVIVLTGGADVESATDALRIGVVDYLQKPPDLEKIESIIWLNLFKSSQVAYRREMEARLRQEVQARTQEAKDTANELEWATEGALGAMVKILEEKTGTPQGHGQAVALLAADIAGALNLSRAMTKEVRTAGLIHEIGRMAIADPAPQSPNPLQSPDATEVKRQIQAASEVLQGFPHMDQVKDYVTKHLERVDGSGHPYGLSGAEIPVGAQIVGAADVFRTLTESGETSPEDALGTLRGAEGSWFSRTILDALERALDT